MNKHLYRIVFNHALSVFQVVAEIVRRPGRSGPRTSAHRATEATVPAMRFALWVALGWVSTLPAFAQVVADPAAPGNQRPTVLQAPNGTPLINIQTPSAAGVSRNTYSQFDVDANGAILNNSRTNTQTQLGGWVQGNPWLATGTARVILNEVNGPASQLNGYVEVAGQRAEVVIANPAGIAVNGGGFINASRVTLTTGAPLLNGGALDGYRVGGGLLSVAGAGLDTSGADYTDLIARAIQINAGIWAQQLQVTTGTNTVSADHAQVTASAPAAGTMPAFALDVGALGGMYSGKIALLATESGVGVRNAGTLGAQAGELTVTVDGRLENTGSLQAKTDTRVTASGGVANAGTISAVRELVITTPQDVDNSGGTLNAQRIEVNAQSLRNRGGAIEQTGVQALALNAGALSNRDDGRIGVAEPDTTTTPGGSTGGTSGGGTTTPGTGTGGGTGTTPPPVVPLAEGALNIAGTLDNDAGQILAGGGIALDTANGVNNDGGQIGLARLTIRGNDLSNQGGHLTVRGAAIIDANQVRNDAGQLAFGESLSLNAQSFSNRGGDVLHSGTAPAAIQVAGTLDNTDGTLASNAAQLALTTGTLVNERGEISHAGVSGLAVTTGTLAGRDGTIATAGALTLNAGQVDHQGATLSATQVAITADGFDNRGGQVIASGTGSNTLTVAGALDNGSAGTIASNGDLSIQANTFGNAGGTVQQAGTGTLAIDAATVNGAGGTLASNGALTVTGETTNLRDGTTVAKRIAIDTGTLTTAGGTLTATGTEVLDLQVRGTLDNTAGTLAGNGALALNAATLTNVDGALQAAGTAPSTIAVATTFDNTRGMVIAAGDTTLSAGILINQGGAVQTAGDAGLQLTVVDRLDNSAEGVIGGGGRTAVSANTLDNRTGTVNSGETLAVAVTQALDNAAGTIAATSNLAVQAQTLVNRNGGVIASIEADADLTTTGLTDNAGGVLQSAGTTTVTSTGLGNTGGTIVGASTRIDTRQQTLDNTAGMIAASAGTLDVRSGALNNDAGLLQSAGAMTVDTNGQTLTNTNAGTSGGVISGGTMHLTTGDLNNTTGLVYAQGDLAARTGALDNTTGGQFAGAANVQLDGTTLRNTGGTVQAGHKLTATLATADNTAGLMLAGGELAITAATIINRDTISADPATSLGLQGDTATLTANRIDNTVGTIAADTQIGIAGTGANSTLDNTEGTVSSTGSIGIAIDMITNTAGTLQSGTSQSIVADAMTGDGRVLSQGGLTIALQQDFDHTGEITANGAAVVSTAGTLTNRSTIQAGDLTISAANVDNTVTGEISGGRTHVVATNTATNRGVIDGVETRIDAATVDNVGTGRIYGDHLSIGAGTLTNREETIGTTTTAATIAARSRLDIGVGTVINQENALIFSAGGTEDALNIGGVLDGDGLATGRANLVHNASATIDSLGGLSISATRLLNTNEHFATTEVQVGGPVDLFYIQPKDDPNLHLGENFVWENWSRAGYYKWATDPAPNGTTELGVTPIPRVGEQSCSGTTDDTCTRIAGADYPAGDPAWGYFGVAEPGPAPVLADYPDQASFNAAQAAWQSQTEARYTQLDDQIAVYNDGFADQKIKNWTQYETTQTEYQTQVTQSAAALIRSGGTMRLNGDELINDKSQIIAGGALIGDLGNLQNIDAEGTHRVHVAGTSQYTYSRWRGGFKRYHEREWDPKVAYTPADVITTVDLNVVGVQTYANGTGSGYTVGTRATTTVDGAIAGGTAAVDGGTDARTINAVSTQIATTLEPGSAGTGGTVASSSTHLPNAVTIAGNLWDLPDSSLFRANTGPGGYLIETDPRFASYRNWLSSDYLLDLLGVDPTHMHKRLGDGFYEQKLIRDQIGQLTGRRFLDGYASDEAQYQALLTASATVAQAWQLRPGVALTAAQMAQLTSDIVWLVEETVRLPDGTTTTALVPRVYLRPRTGDLTGSGTLISAEAIGLDLQGDLVNGGTIAGRTAVQLTADNLRNLGGRITGTDVRLDARTDIDNIGGVIDAGNSLVATAGRDLNVVTTTRSDAKQAGQSDFSRTNIDRVAGLYVTNPGGTLVLLADRDINMTGAQIVNAGKGPTALTAGNDINLSTVQVAVQENNVRNPDNDLKQGETLQVGSRIQGQGNVTVSAGHDLNAMGADITSVDGTLVAAADNDVNLSASVNTSNWSEGRKHTHNSALSSTTTTTRDSLEESWGQGTTLSGNKVLVQAGNDINVAGSNVVSTAGTALVAGNDINIGTSTNTVTENHFKQTQESGLFTTGGVGFTIGKRTMENSADIVDVTHTGSMIGSTGGRVDLVAGGDVTITGSDVLSKEGIGIVGQNVTIEAAENSSTVVEQQKYRQAGLNVSLKGGVVDTAMAVYSAVERANQVQDDRLSALYMAKAGQTLFSGGGAGMNSIASTGDQLTALGNTDKNTKASGGSGLSLRIGIGASKSDSKMTYDSSSAHGSTISSGGDVVIHVTGDAQGNGGDLTVAGSRIEGDDVTLAANRDLLLQSMEETTTQVAKDSASSGEIGVTIGTEAGIGVYVSASMSKGSGKGVGTSHAETTVEAANTLTLISGNDMTLHGAQAKGERVVADIGGDLTITSQQDTNDYKRKDQSASIDVAVGFGGATVSGSYNQSKIDSTYTSVVEQSGIQAGAGGFDINVAGHTQLNGGAIASTAEASRNYLSTGSLAYTDLKNEAEYKATSFGFSGSAGSGGGGMSVSLPPPKSDSASSTTKASISAGTLIAADGSGSGIDRSVTTLQQDGLKQIFDERKVNEAIEMGQVAGEVGMKAAGDLSSKMGWKEGSPEKAILHGVVGGAIAALVGGDLLQGVSGAALNQLAFPTIKKLLEDQGVMEGTSMFDSLMTLASIAVGTAVGGETGASTALAGEQFNRQLHFKEVEFLKDDKVIADYIAYMAAQGVVLTEAQATSNLDRYGAAGEDAHWAGLNGRDPMTEAFLNSASEGRYYIDSEGKQHAYFQSNAQEYQNETINLNSLYGSRFDPAVRTFLDHNKAPNAAATPLNQTLYFQGQQRGYAADGKEAGLLNDLDAFGRSVIQGLGSVVLSGYSERIGPYDELALSNNYQLLLKDQGRWGEAGYVDAVNWAAAQRLTWVGVGVSGASAAALGAITRSGPGAPSTNPTKAPPKAPQTWEPLTNPPQPAVADSEAGTSVGSHPVAINGGLPNNGIDYSTISTAGPKQPIAPRNLIERAAWNGVLENPSAGRPLNLSNDPRFRPEDGFQKMETTTLTGGGKRVTIHYQYNSNTGKPYDIKIVYPPNP